MILLRAILALVLLGAHVPVRADAAPTIHYAPAENLERIDVSLIDGARAHLDMAAYVLTDWPVINALERAARRGVKVRLYLDGGSMLLREPSPPFRALLENPDIAIRAKRSGAPLMHLKSYQIDGRLLRTGAANFSASGLKRQDNDLIVIESRAAVEGFLRRFEAIFASSESLARAGGRDEADKPWLRRKRQRWSGALPSATETLPDRGASEARALQPLDR
jgi:phosphatidylserine/phosphatidylglycerophosphate/cardiolipin synthase-like enzyme